MNNTRNGDDGRPAGEPYYELCSRWSYRTRPSEEHSYAIVLAQTDDLGEHVIHLQVHGIALRVPGSDQLITALLHLPMSVRAVRQSLWRQIDTAMPAEGWLPGFEQWRAAGPEQQVWDLPIAAILDQLATNPPN